MRTMNFENRVLPTVAATLFFACFNFVATVESFANNCDSLIASISLEEAITCYGGNNGALAVQVSGGTVPYQFIWNSGDSTSTLTELDEGVYSVNIIDANQCFTVAFYNLTEPDQENAEMTIVPPLCGNEDGSLTISPSGDDAPYQFSLNNEAFQFENQFDDLAAGAYVIQFVNNTGCTSVVYAVVNPADSEVVESSAIEDNSCFGDCVAIAELVNESAGDFEYSWFELNEDGSTLSIDQQDMSATGLCSGVYYAMVEETGGGTEEDLFWTEDFGTGCNQGQSGDGFVSENGTWTIVNTGINETYSNSFFVSAAEQIGDSNCGTVCGGGSSRTLHVSNTEITFMDIVILPADGGAVYLSDAATNVRAESPTIDCSDHSSIELSFDYIESGQAAFDNATLWYYDGNDWVELVDLPKTTCCGGPCNGSNQGLFVNYSIDLPPSANNNPDVKIGFNWTNNNDSQGSDPSFAVDNLEVFGTSVGNAGCTTFSPVVEIEEPEPLEIFLVKFGNAACNGGDDGAIQVQGSGGSSPYSYLWNIDSTSSAITNLSAGEYTVTVSDANDCEISETYEIGEPSEAELVDFTFEDNNLIVQFNNTSSPGNYLWDFGDGNTSEEANPMHEYATSGMFEVCLTLISDCGDQMVCEMLNLISTDISEKGFPDFMIYPNPVVNQLNISVSVPGMHHITFYDVQSRQQYVTTVSGQQVIDVSGWSAGVYLYVVENADRSARKHGKMVIR